MIILITASLSSNTYNKASWWEEFTFEEIKSTVRNWSLFLTHPTDWNKRMASKKAQCSTRSRFLNPQDLLQIRSLETVPVCIVCQCFPHSNTVHIYMYDECRRSNDLIVRHTLWSILWSIVHVSSLTVEYRVFQHVPSKSISGQFESILLTILPRISILLLWNDGRQCKELILCRFVESFCSPTHNIVPNISWYDLPCHRTTKKYADFPSMVIFQLLPRGNSWFKHGSVIVNNIFAYFTLSLRTHQVYMVKNDVGSPKSTSLLSTFHIRLIFCFFPANLMLSTNTDKNNPFSRCTNKHSQLETFSQTCCNRIFSNCLFHNSPAEGWPYRFRSRGKTGSSIVDHYLGHLRFGWRIQISGHSDFEIFNNFGASSISTWEKADTASAACPAHPGSLDMTSMTFAAVICDADARPLYFWCSVSNSAFFKWQMSISEANWTFAPFVLASSTTSDVLLTFVRSRARIFSSFSHSVSTAAFCCGNLHGLRHRNKFVYQIVML